jgi:hypothetical protein
MGTVFIGAFHDEQVSQVIAMDQEEMPMGIMPVGNYHK